VNRSVTKSITENQSYAKRPAGLDWLPNKYTQPVRAKRRGTRYMITNEVQSEPMKSLRDRFANTSSSATKSNQFG
jgi:hypothetical protein